MLAVYVIALLVLLITFVYLISRSFGDYGIPGALIIFLFGPLVAWIYILFLSKDKWPKKAVILVIYYTAAVITLQWLFVLNAQALQLREEANEETEIENQIDYNEPDNSFEEEDSEFSTEPSMEPPEE